MWFAFVPFAFANCADLPHLPLWFESFQPILHWLNPGVVRLLLGDHAKRWGLLLGFWDQGTDPHAFSVFRRRRMIRMAGIIEKLQVVDAPAESCALRRASLIRAIVALIHGFCGKDWDTWQRNTGVDRWKILGNHFSSCDASWIGHGTHDFQPTFKLANSLWHHRPHSPFNFFGKKPCAPNVVRDHNFYLFRPCFFNRYEWRHCRGDSAKADQARVSTQPILVFHCTKRRLHWSGPTTTQRGRCNEHLVESRRMTYRICWRHPTHGKKPNFRSSS